jgi:DNA-binding MarR family transcriptional regulator
MPAPAPSKAAAPLLEQRFSFLFHRMAARVASIGNQHFKKHKLNHYSARILVLLLEHRELRNGELVELMLLPQSTISTQLLALNKRRLISRRRSRQDNRSVIVSLTPAGQVVAQDCDMLSARVQDELAQLFDAGSLPEIYALLQRMEQRLAEMEQDSLHPFSD